MLLKAWLVPHLSILSCLGCLAFHADDVGHAPLALQDAGYSTYFTGKYLNGMTPQMVQQRCPKCVGGAG
jgi:hypothetical protein